MHFTEFKNRVMATYRLDLHGYKENQLQRRLDAYIDRLKLKNYEELFNQITKEKDSYEKFVDYLTINVSEFFRDPQKFFILKEKYFPELFKKRQQVKIWSAACSNGAEPYSMAIILEELGLLSRASILATDIDKIVLNKAMEAKYGCDSLNNVSKERINRFFTKQGNFYLLNDAIKKKVTYRYHNLLDGKYQRGYDLIACRNVTIYFTREAQNEIYKQFSCSLNPGGMLFIGGCEVLFNYRELGFEKLSPCFYKKN